MAKRVFHPEYGSGEVVTYRRGGRVAIVDFESRPMPTHVPVREFAIREVDEKEDETDRSGVDDLLATGPRFEGSRDETESSRVLEAMRLGVVPSSSIDVYTVGRDVEVGQVQADLGRADRGDGAVRAFLGDYGTGKTHLLQLAQNRALENNFLAAHVVLDPRETPPSHPKRVYRDLVHSLQYPDRRHDEDTGLEPLFDQAVADDEVREQFDVRRGKGDRDKRLAEDGMHLYLSPALSYYRELAADDVRDRVEDVDDLDRYLDDAETLLFDWIEGHPTISNTDLNDHLSHIEGAYPWLYSLMDYRPWARIYGYMLSGLSTLARAVGYSGLAVFVDEAERFSLLSAENREFARYVFKALSFAAVGDAGVPFDRAQLDDLGGWGIQKELPPRYGEATGMYAVFAMTPHEEGIESLHQAIPPGKVSELGRFDDRDYAELAAKVCDFYASAYPDWEMTERTVTRCTSLVEDCRSRGHIANPRDAMKFLVEFLDIARRRPDEVGDVVRQLEHLTMA
ncbi:MAG: BREX system ATP-binding domain-containing protein [Bradymonadaceae bacterium]